ncbi:hypothetical protein L6452_40135 [Arctium lappa]|uniref:Uncharacterized protein n=1 Tax=Arctium lappa TaxID=4217 RepID=A0ACB8XKK5_ARCLA|nr:hypothetical protein L6452_40135 [Arctium lappa]
MTPTPSVLVIIALPNTNTNTNTNTTDDAFAFVGGWTEWFAFVEGWMERKKEINGLLLLKDGQRGRRRLVVCFKFGLSITTDGVPTEISRSRMGFGSDRGGEWEVVASGGGSGGGLSGCGSGVGTTIEVTGEVTGGFVAEASSGSQVVKTLGREKEWWRLIGENVKRN